MAKNGPPQLAPYPAEKARGGEIVLRRRWQRVVFVIGLAGPVVLLVVFLFAHR
jgi:hypothetical protein